MCCYPVPLAQYHLRRQHSVNGSYYSLSVGQSHLLSTRCMPGTALGAGDTAVNKTGKSCSVGLTPSPPQALLGVPGHPVPPLCRRWPVVAGCPTHPRPAEVAPVVEAAQIFRIKAYCSFPSNPTVAVPRALGPDAQSRACPGPSPLTPAPFSTPAPGCVSIHLSIFSSVPFFFSPTLY